MACATETLASIRRALEAGEQSSVELVRICVERILRHEPELRALLHPAPKRSAFEPALAAAERADRERPRGPLGGIPFVAKDSFDVAGMPTSGGSAAIELHPVRDAAVVARLRQAGAIVLAKSNMSELALSEGRLGYSSRRGTTRNPSRPRRDAAGSSSGSAAAVALGFAPFALGSDSAGSVRAPAAATGLVALKPTTGALSSEGLMPLSPSLDVPGILARGIGDLHFVWSVLRGGASSASPYVPRIGVFPRLVERAAPGFARSFAEVLRRIADAGMTVREAAWPAGLEPDSLWSQVLSPIVDAEFCQAIERYFARAGCEISLASLIERSERHNAQPPGDGTFEINPARIEAYRRAAAKPTAELDRAWDQRERWRQQLAEIFDRLGFDVVVFPTLLAPPGPLWSEREGRFVDDDVHRIPGLDPFMTCYIASATGMAEVTLTAQGERPLAISIMGRPGDDDGVLFAAAELERILG